MFSYWYDKNANIWHYYDQNGNEMSATEVSRLIQSGGAEFMARNNPPTSGAVLADNPTITIKEGEGKMAAFQVVVTQKVLKNVDANGNERTQVERVLVDERVHAATVYAAALIAGMKLPKDSDAEILASSTTTVSVNATN